LLLEGLDGSLYLVDSVALAREVVGSLCVREGVTLVIFEDNTDTGHRVLASFDSPPRVEQMLPIYLLTSSRASGQEVSFSSPNEVEA
jgi:hypothetical protein